MKQLKIEYQHYDLSDDELEKKLQAAIQDYEETLETYFSAHENGFVIGIKFHPETYRHKEIFLKIVEKNKSENLTYSAPLAERKMADCSPKEQIVKIKEREIRKVQIENNKQFEEVVQMIRETKYIDTKKALSVDEMVAFSLTLYENNVDYVGRQRFFSKLLGNTSKMTDVKIVENFKKKFKKEIFHKLIRYILTKQVHFGDNNHVNNLTNISFYNAMQGYYKTKIAKIEEEYEEKRKKRETRLKERIESLEKQIQELNDKLLLFEGRVSIRAGSSFYCNS
ncbi:hypothetical protein [Mesonia sp. K4-1]|jgi:ParB family chromosome partitioning protein|uniref:hypothetical protein n=1 Tax=Mesonia sp. K4-1 TaxID=2602760 RepID=UPI002103E18E|nr:hypothetical protein [Mesonia sp. K4-1]